MDFTWDKVGLVGKTTSDKSGFVCGFDLWQSVAKALPKPWIEDAVHIDLSWWHQKEQLKTGARPGRRKLASRWGWAERKARQVVEEFDKSRPNVVPVLSQKSQPKSTQVVEITTGGRPNVVPVSSHETRIREVFDLWHVLQRKRSGRTNKMTAGRKRVLSAALKSGHSTQDLMLVIRMAFEYPEGDFLVDGWRKGGYMDITNLLNREKVDRNVTLANERWDGSDWIFEGQVDQERQEMSEKAWASVVQAVGELGSEPAMFSRNDRINESILAGLEAIGGWCALGDAAGDYARSKMRAAFCAAFNNQHKNFRQPIKLMNEATVGK